MTVNGLVLGAEPLLGQRSGVGQYTWQLCRRLVATEAISDLRLIANGRWLDAESPQLDAATGRERTTSGAAADSVLGAASGPWIATGALRGRVRTMVHKLPGYVPARTWVGAWMPDPGLRQVRRFLRQPPGGFLYHEPNFVLRPFAGPAITTIHDLGWLHYPAFVERVTLRLLEQGMPGTIERAERIITVSNFVAGEVEQVLGVERDRISVTPLGVSPDYHPRPARATQPMLEETYGLCHGGFLLSVSTLDPRKNLAGLVAAFSRLPAALQRRFPLILVGSPGWGDALSVVDTYPLERSGLLRRLGYVPDAHLPLLYAGAAALAMPSLYEGFGLPVLEAMASGIPVLTSDRGAMLEVAGDAALLVDPEDDEALRDGLHRLLDDAHLRRVLRERGLARAERFTWDETFEATLAAYRRVFS